MSLVSRDSEAGDEGGNFGFVRTKRMLLPRLEMIPYLMDKTPALRFPSNLAQRYKERWNENKLATIRRICRDYSVGPAKQIPLLKETVNSDKADPGYQFISRLLLCFDDEVMLCDLTNDPTGQDKCCAPACSTSDVDDTIGETIQFMQRWGFSQLPILEEGHLVGQISERHLINHQYDPSDRVGDHLDVTPPVLHARESIQVAEAILKFEESVLFWMGDGEEKELRIVTRTDIIRWWALTLSLG